MICVAEKSHKNLAEWNYPNVNWKSVCLPLNHWKKWCGWIQCSNSFIASNHNFLASHTPNRFISTDGTTQFRTEHFHLREKVPNSNFILILFSLFYSQYNDMVNWILCASYIWLTHIFISEKYTIHVVGRIKLRWTVRLASICAHTGLVDIYYLSSVCVHHIRRLLAFTVWVVIDAATDSVAFWDLCSA